jgi:Family of unknown function (DUF6090)
MEPQIPEPAPKPKKREQLRITGILRKIRTMKSMVRMPRPSRKTRVYFFVYSIELLVVMLGVIAGFGMNNYAESRREKKQLVEFLNGLETDLATDLENLRAGDSMANQKMEELVSLIGLLKSNDTSQLATINELIQESIQENRFFYPANTTYQSVKQGGQVNLIKDFQFKSDLIYLYEFQYGQLRVREEIILEDLRSKIEPLVMASYDLVEFRALNTDNLFSVQFTNYLQQMLTNHSATLQYFKEAQAKCEAIRKRIQEKKLRQDY